MSVMSQLISSDACSVIVMVRQGDVGAVFPLADPATGESGDLVRPVERLHAGQAVELGHGGRQKELIERVVNRVLDTRLGELRSRCLGS